MADKNEYASFTNATTENVTTRPDQVNRQLDPNYTEIAKLMSIAAGIVIINSVVFYLFFKKKTLRTASNYPLFSLAACDFFCGSVIIPLFTIFSFTPLVESQKIKFYVGFLVTVLHNFVAIATVYHIVVVTAERYMAIKFPLKHRLLHLNCICKVLAIVWIGFRFLSASADATVFLHCEVEACREGDSESRCAKGCEDNGSRKRRSLVLDALAKQSVTIGPVRATKRAKVEQGQRSASSLTVIAAVAGVLAVVVLALTVALVMLYKRYRSPQNPARVVYTKASNDDNKLLV